MPTYLTVVTDPTLRAEVEAPTTRKARTVLLDYLERTGIIERDERQDVRSRILTKKVRPGISGSDLFLDYDMQDELPQMPVPEQVASAPRVEAMREFLEEEEFEFEPVPQRQTTKLPIRPYRPEEEVSSMTGSPIANIARSGVPTLRRF